MYRIVKDYINNSKSEYYSYILNLDEKIFILHGMQGGIGSTPIFSTD